MSEDKRRVLFRDMIYIGDGITDIPCMQLIKDKGGKSIAVYNDVKKVNAKRLFSDSRVNFVCKADYSENSELEQIVKIQIQSCALAHKLENKASKQRKSILKEIK